MSDFPFTGRISDTGEHPRLADWYKAVKYHCLCRKGKLVDLPEPKQLSNTRSAVQNRYYWGLIGLLVKYTGNSKTEFHDGFRKRWFFKVIVIGEDEIETLRSTTEAEPMEMYDYIEKIREWQQKFLPECYLPTPVEWKRWEEEGIQEVAA